MNYVYRSVPFLSAFTDIMSRGNIFFISLPDSIFTTFLAKHLGMNFET